MKFAPKLSATLDQNVIVENRPSANSVKELIVEAKRAPGKLNIAIAGATGEIATNLIKIRAFPTCRQ